MTPPLRERGAAFWDQVVDGAFGHGYVVHLTAAAGLSVPDLLSAWPVQHLDGWTYRIHPRAALATAADRSGRRIVLIGHPIDVAEGIADAEVIARQLLRTLAGAGPEAVVREAAYLGGRWTLFVQHHPGRHRRRPAAGKSRRAGSLWAVPDAHASQAVFYAATGPEAVLASSDVLVGQLLDLPRRSEAERLLARAKELRPRGTRYLPGTVTDVDGVLPLVPNCLLELDLDVAPDEPVRRRHRRFWPWKERTPATDADTTYQDFRARLAAHCALIAQLGPAAISLTAGLDSRVTLAHLLQGPVRPAGLLAFTYVNPREVSSNAGVADDLFGASTVAHRCGVMHRVLRWRQAPQDSAFAHLHARTHPHTHVSSGAAHAMWADLPHDIVQLQSNGGETGTVFGRDRSAEPISPARLATLWLGPAFATETRYLDLFEEYAVHSDFGAATMLGYDYHDLNYWEHRMGRWGYRKFGDGDLSHRVLAPFNDRGLLETMLSLPEEQRVDKYLYRRTLADHPEVGLNDS